MVPNVRKRSFREQTPFAEPDAASSLLLVVKHIGNLYSPHAVVRHQCLAFANGDLASAVKVASKFARFRIDEGWGLVLLPTDVEKPLRSRVHTLTEARDR